MKNILYISVVLVGLFTFNSCEECDTTIMELPAHELPVDCPALGLDIGDPCDDGDPNTFEDTVNDTCQCVGIPMACANQFIGFASIKEAPPLGFNYDLEVVDKPITPFANRLLVADVQVNSDQFIFPSNYATYNKNTERYTYVLRYDGALPLRQYYTYDYNTDQEFISDPISETYAAPVYLNNELYAIRYFTSGEFSIVRIDAQNGQILETLLSNAISNVSPVSELFGASSTDNVDRLFFLSNTNLIVYNVSSSTFRYVELEIDYDPEAPIVYYGLEYDQQNNELIMLRLVQTPTGGIINELVSFNPDNNTSASVVLNLDNLLMQTNDVFINLEFFDTELDDCDRSFYISEIVDAEEFSQSNLIKISLDDLTSSTRVVSDFRFGLELVD